MTCHLLYWKQFSQQGRQHRHDQTYPYRIQTRINRAIKQERLFNRLWWALESGI